LTVDGALARWEWIGVQADSHWAADGIAVGTRPFFDRSGAFGSGMTTAVANPKPNRFANDPLSVADTLGVAGSLVGG